MTDKQVTEITWPKNNPHIHVQQASFGRGYDIAVFMDSLDGEPFAYNVTSMTAKTITEGDQTHKCLTISNESAKHLMDSLWLNGVRPSKVDDQSAVIAAMEKHILALENQLADKQHQTNDMRNLIFEHSVLKGIPKVEEPEA